MPEAAADADSARLARALQRAPEEVEAVLLEVGVDAPYLSRALLEGDPQGAMLAVSQRLGVPRRQLAIAVLRSVALPEGVGDPRSRAQFAARAHAARRTPRFARAAVATGVAGTALVVLGSMYALHPSLFRELALAAAAVGAVGGGVALLIASFRLARVAWRARRLR